MNIRSLIVFFHVLGAMLAFTVAGIEIIALDRFRRATARSEATGWMRVIKSLSRAHAASFVILLGSGIFLMVAYWHHQPWIDVGMTGLVVMAGLGGAVTGGLMRRLGRELASGGNELTPAFRAVQSGRGLVASLRVRVSIGVSMIAVMTLKPGYSGSLLIVAAAIVMGWLIGLRVDRRRAADAASGDRSIAA